MKNFKGASDKYTREVILARPAKTTTAISLCSSTRIWHQSLATRYVISLCKQLKAAPRHSALLARVAALTVGPMSLHINPRGVRQLNGIPQRHVCSSVDNKNAVESYLLHKLLTRRLPLNLTSKMFTLNRKAARCYCDEGDYIHIYIHLHI